MAPSFFSARKPSTYTPPDPAMQMPNVFVVPPEEDETPAWCFFDAENPASSEVIEHPETVSLFSLAEADAYAPMYDERADDMDTTITPKNFANVSVVDALITDNYRGQDDIDSDTESEYEQDTGTEDDPNSIRESTRHQPRDAVRNVADDSDVIEVVKVSRKTRTGVQDADIQQEGTGSYPGVKRTATLKARASKVFRSLTGTLRSKPKGQDGPVPPLPASTVPPVPSLPQTEVVDRSRSPTVVRRASKTLSDLFTPPSLKSQSSMASLDDRPPMSPTESSFTTSPPPSMRAPSKPLSRRPSLYTAAEHEEARLRTTSPTPTTSSAKSTTRRISVTLQKLFSFSAASSTATPSFAEPEDSGRTTPTPRSTTSTPASVMSSVLTTGPQTPTSTEEVNSVRLVSPQDPTDLPAFESFESVFDANVGLNLGLGLGLDLNTTSTPNITPRKSRSSSLKHSWEAMSSKRFTKGPPAHMQAPDLDEDGDASLEMRLDSFHFDDLSFDADQFTAN